MANPKVIEKKKTIVNEITEKIKEAQSVVFFDYSGLSVVELTELRKALKEIDSEFKVYKNTLTRRALNNLNIDLENYLEGPKAILFGPDAVAPIKVLNDFAKKHDTLEMKVGIVEGQIVGLDTLKELAKISSKDTLLNQFAYGLMGVVRDFAICVDLYAKKLEENKKEEL